METIVSKALQEDSDRMESVVSCPNFDGSSPISPSIVVSVEAIDGSASSLQMETLDGDSIRSSPSSPDRVLAISSGVPDSDENLGGSSLVETLADQSLVSLPPNPIGSPQSAPFSSSNDGVSSSSSEIENLDGHTLVPSVWKPTEPALLEAQDCSASPKMSSWTVAQHPLRWPLQRVNPIRWSSLRRELQKDDSDQPLCLLDNGDELNPSEDCILLNSFNDRPGYVQRRITSQWPHHWSPWESRNRFCLETKPTGVGAGLENLGNTCFLNAILQCFTHTVPFLQHLRSYSHEMPDDCTNDGFCVICALREHVDLALASSGKSISPLKLVDNLNYFSSTFQRNQQEDAHEFLQCFLEKLERSCLNSKASGESLPSKDDNIVDQVFGGRLVSKLQCCNCGDYSDKYEPMIDLSLEIEDVHTLLSALDSFTRVEKIEDPEARIKCEKCNEMASREKQLMLDQAPKVAALHLKRFKTNGCFVQKIDKHVEFPLELDLNPYTSGHLLDNDVELKYQLHAVVVHRGYYSTSGHYFCYIRSDLGTWHQLDDSMVYTATEEFVLSQNAYILFYAREGTPWFSKFWESQKPSLDFGSFNTSPKSVLDDVDGESTMHSNSAKLGNCTSYKSIDSAEENLTNLSCRSKQEEEIKDTEDVIATWFNAEPGLNGASHSCNESGGDSLMVDALVPPSTTDGCEQILGDDFCSTHSLEENDCTQDPDTGVKIEGLLPSTRLKSRSLDVNHGGSSESNFRLHGHLKVGKQSTNKKPLRKSRKHSEKVEAFRYLNRCGNSSRKTAFMAALR
ncbi:ubiquitin carboxyl-terminal hydrolase 20-like isoform X2 [Tripterygium wilfordii]|uniref:ubiquitin carboxyl-terminal hydrolase 20-like isoform X2 n=1 Tax=Tripterygium wilfordii TaxID=458696 RepID=UPI0018F85A3C|nr:ubiquitin carboxyl-terminal hydrolase 20-like isoform X2 [Tripterygium wilfordii]